MLEETLSTYHIKKIYLQYYRVIILIFNSTLLLVVVQKKTQDFTNPSWSLRS